MSKIKKRVVEYYSFYCPGCKHEHSFMVSDDGNGWSFNGNIESPTFTPSLLNRRQIKDDITKELIDQSRCHLFVIDGKIEYCSDCSHEFSGRVVEL